MNIICKDINCSGLQMLLTEGVYTFGVQYHNSPVCICLLSYVPSSAPQHFLISYSFYDHMVHKRGCEVCFWLLIDESLN